MGKGEGEKSEKYGLKEEKEITFGLKPEAEKRKKELEGLLEQHKKQNKPLYIINIQAENNLAIKDAMLLANILDKIYYPETRLSFRSFASGPYDVVTKKAKLLVHLIGVDEMAEKKECDPIGEMKQGEARELVADLCEYFDALAELGGDASTILCISSQKPIKLPDYTLYIDHSNVYIDKKDIEKTLESEQKELEIERRAVLENERRKFA